ncbi:hypothetical protein VPG91_11505 [Nitrospirillum amazonense]|uniref:hypothetical protein n=1 Tax=Nitrospirillum amazonense TaxID=28077 RepID=UPI002DD441DD|nr:hypothetical protein [Nitrospirillum amazonense]MEC4591615.1 hypothetical protein [Nitrospirillum amazonense]
MAKTSTDGAESAPPEAVPADGAASPDLSQRVDAAVAAWLAEDIHNSPVARATDAYNHMVSVLPALRDRILAVISET